MLDVVKLATLRAVLAERSFSAAARQLHLTQPAVSRQVALLEKQLGTPLVRRAARGVLPTEAGALLAAHADTVLRELRRAEDEVRRLAGLGRGTVRLGSFFSALVHLSAELAALLAERHPGLVVADELVDRGTAMERLSAGNLDLALVVEHDFEPAPAVDGVEVHDLFDDPVRVVLPAGHRLAGSRAVRVEDLREETWIRPHEGSAARRVDVLLVRAGLRPAILLAGRGDEPVELQALVAAGRGVTVTHDLTVAVGQHAVVFRPVLDGGRGRTVQVAVPAGPRPPAVDAALEALAVIGDRHRRRLGGRP